MLPTQPFTPSQSAIAAPVPSTAAITATTPAPTFPAPLLLPVPEPPALAPPTCTPFGVIVTPGAYTFSLPLSTLPIPSLFNLQISPVFGSTPPSLFPESLPHTSLAVHWLSAQKHTIPHGASRHTSHTFTSCPTSVLLSERSEAVEHMHPAGLQL